MTENTSLVEVSALDHVHKYMSDPEAAVAWYGRVLGLKPFATQRDAVTGAGGIYMATAAGQYCATFFRGVPPSDGDHTAAFRVSGKAFIAFGNALTDAEVPARGGGFLRRKDAADHELAFSYYFQDPDGNHLEITTYDHPKVRTWFEALE